MYRAVDSDGNTLDFLLTAKRDAEAAKRFFHKALSAVHTPQLRVINVDRNAYIGEEIVRLGLLDAYFASKVSLKLADETLDAKKSF